MHPTVIAPSLLASDFAHLADECARARTAGGDWLHLDVMDGHFVDNITFGPVLVEAARRSTTLPLDVHLMIERPDRYLPQFLPAADVLTVHVEARHDVAATLLAIRAAGKQAGLALSPPTPFEAVEPHLPAIDLLLVMTVNPGFGGQPFLPETLDKVRMASARRAGLGAAFRIEVDGGINAETAALARAAGADTLVAGTSVFRAPDPAAAVRAMRG